MSQPWPTAVPPEWLEDMVDPTYIQGITDALPFGPAPAPPGPDPITVSAEADTTPGLSVTLVATGFDAGVNFASINWGQGSPVPSAPIVDGVLTERRTYPGSGTYTVTVLATNGQTGTDSVTVSVTE